MSMHLRRLRETQRYQPKQQSVHESNPKTQLIESYHQLQDRARRTLSFYEHSQTTISQKSSLVSIQQQQELLKVLNKKVLLCFPKSLEAQGFQPFKQLKLQNLQSLPNHLRQVQANPRLRTEERLINEKAAQVLSEVNHNKKMKLFYKAAMFREQESQHRQLRTRQEQLQRRNYSLEQPQPSDRTEKHTTFKEKMTQNETDHYVQNMGAKATLFGHVSRISPSLTNYNIPECREGAKLLRINEKQALLLGGYSHKEHSYIHQLDLDTYRWARKEAQTISKALGCSFQTVMHADCVYLMGGERRNGGGRLASNELWRMKDGRWDQMVYGGDYLEPRKNFSLVLAGKGKYLVVIGGVGNDYKFFGDIHAIDLTLGKNTALQQGEDVMVGHPYEFGIAYHSSFGTNPDQGGPDMLLYQDYKKKTNQKTARTGIFTFGGKNSKAQTFQELYYINTLQLPHVLELVPTKGQRPYGRHSFSLNYSPRGQMVAIFGGTDDERIYGDLYLLFLNQMQWVHVRLVGDMIPPRFDHCSVFHDTHLVVLGGVCTGGFRTCEPYVIELNQKVARALIQENGKLLDEDDE